jgi:hypothetical protein
MSNRKDVPRGFIDHGVEFEKTAGNQAIGNCPFCNKDNHFFVNVENQLWDCKKCGAKGNFHKFLDLISKQNVKTLYEQPSKMMVLAIDRKLPKSAFLKWEVGWNGKEYTLPVRNPNGVVEDLRRYSLGGKTQATSGAKLGLLGAHKLAQMPGSEAYICEGEWDCIALAWLFKKLNTNCVAVGVPGASVFKDTWISLFEGRKVFLMHDKDKAGEEGKKLCFGKLKGVAKEIKVVEWPEFLPEGFDIRDFVVNEAIAKQKPRNAWGELKKLLKIPEEVRIAPVSSGLSSEAMEPSPDEVFNGVRITSEEVAAAYRKWLYLPSDEVLKIIFGVVFANKIQGEPLWMFLVAPPGGSKSELLMSLSKHSMIETTTSLTPHTLISGVRFTGNNDPSLLPRLHNRILVVKDFTTLLSMHFTSRDEIFGILRDCYDGKTEKIFGMGYKRSYVSHFGILAGVTPKIEEFGAIHQSLGERFLKYRIDTGTKTKTEADRIRRALSNINHEEQMRTELCRTATQVLSMPLPDILPTIPESIFEKIVNLAQTCAMMRGIVERDRYTQMVIYKPAVEVGTRLAKQFAKLAIGIAIYLQKPEIDLDIYLLVCRVALDTAPDTVEEVVRRLWEGCKAPGEVLTTRDISVKTRLPQGTCLRILQDLELLRLVDRSGRSGKSEWNVSEVLTQLIQEGKVYSKNGN